MKPGDLVFVRGKGLIPQIIEEFDGEFSHVAVVMSETKVLQAQGLMRSGIVNFKLDDNCVAVNLMLTDKQRELIYPSAMQLCDYRYNYMKVLGYGFQELFHFRIHNLFKSPNELLCSELADFWLYNIGWLGEDEYLGDRTPNELYRYVMNRLRK